MNELISWSDLIPYLSDSIKDKKQDEPNVVVLGPEHPKMKRFQKALKEHLKRQVYLADLEIKDIETEFKSVR